MFIKHSLKSLLVITITIAIMLGIYSMIPEKSHAAGKSVASATAIKLGRTHSEICEAEDLTWYYFKFKTLSDKGLYYKFKSVKEGDSFLTAQIIDSGYNDVDPIDGPTGEGFGCHLTSQGSKIYNLKPNRTYYIRVFNEYNYEDIYYTIRGDVVVRKPARSKIFSAKAKGRKITVSYKKMNFATQYQYRFRKTDGNWSKVKSCGNKCRKSFKVKKGGKKYVVQVRARRKYNGKWYTGKWSAGKKVRVK